MNEGAGSRVHAVRPLDDVKVLDLSRVLAGPACTQTLSDLGAEVWKIEAPGGDDTRSWMPPELGGESTYFLCCNRGKKSVVLDLRAAEGQEAARDLAARADVLVENFRPGALDRFGLSYEALCALNPRLIYCSISGYGRTGRRSTDPGYDFNIQAESGLMSITGEPSGQPMKYGVAISDLVTGMNAVQAILAALIAREKTGKGQLLDIALYDSAIALLANVGSGYLQTGALPRRYGNAHATVVPYQTFETSDGGFALAIGNDAQFRTLCLKVLARSDLADDPRFIRNRERVLNREPLIRALQDEFRARASAEWIRLLRGHGLPCGEVRTVAEALDAPETSDRSMVQRVPDRLHGELRLVASPLKLGATPVREPTAPPRLGEHTSDVLTRELGYDAGRIEAVAGLPRPTQKPTTPAR